MHEVGWRVNETDAADESRFMRGFGPGMEPKKIQRYLELMSNERVAALFGLSPTGTKEKVRSKESSTLKSIYDL